MYYKVRVQDTIRITPNKFSDNLDEVVKEIVQTTPRYFHYTHLGITRPDPGNHTRYLQITPIQVYWPHGQPDHCRCGRTGKRQCLLLRCGIRWCFQDR